jgi:hypothetical protein
MAPRRPQVDPILHPGIFYEMANPVFAASHAFIQEGYNLKGSDEFQKHIHSLTHSCMVRNDLDRHGLYYIYILSPVVAAVFVTSDIFPQVKLISCLCALVPTMLSLLYPLNQWIRPHCWLACISRRITGNVTTYSVVVFYMSLSR